MAWVDANRPDFSFFPVYRGGVDRLFDVQKITRECPVLGFVWENI